MLGEVSLHVSIVVVVVVVCPPQFRKFSLFSFESLLLFYDGCFCLLLTLLGVRRFCLITESCWFLTEIRLVVLKWKLTKRVWKLRTLS